MYNMIYITKTCFLFNFDEKNWISDGKKLPKKVPVQEWFNFKSQALVEIFIERTLRNGSRTIRGYSSG